jgi:integrase
LRQAELLGLTWGDLVLDAGVLHVRMQLDPSGVRVVPKTPQAVREVEMFPALVKVLRAHREAMLGRGFAKPTDYVFSTETGGPMYYRNVSARGLGKAVERAGLDEDGKPSLRFHDLHHTYASMLIGQGEDVTYVAAQMGHASAKITLDVYARLFDRHGRSDARGSVVPQFPPSRFRPLIHSEAGRVVVLDNKPWAGKHLEAA